MRRGGCNGSRLWPADSWGTSAEGVGLSRAIDATPAGLTEVRVLSAEPLLTILRTCREVGQFVHIHHKLLRINSDLLHHALNSLDLLGRCQGVKHFAKVP